MLERNRATERILCDAYFMANRYDHDTDRAWEIDCLVEAIEHYCDSHGTTYRVDLRRRWIFFEDIDLTDCERVQFESISAMMRERSLEE